MLTIEAWDYYNNDKNQEIDIIVKSIPFREVEDEVNIVEFGTNGIGQFDFSYRIEDFSNNCSTGSDANPHAHSTSLWAWIAMATLLVTFFFTISIAICIARNVCMKMKETMNARDRDGKLACRVIKVCFNHESTTSAGNA